MVYHGVVSKGCQRCRQRKIKCDQRKPACLKCEKSGRQCPGYRDLHQVMFRDESERVIRKARQIEQSSSIVTQETTPISPKSSRISTPVSELNSLTPSLSTLYPLSLSTNDLGANFLFSNYFFNDPPFYNHYYAWVAKSYYESQPNHVLRAVIEAVGMAGLSNVFHSPRVKSASEEQYCKALVAMKEALKDPAQVTADTTLLAVILLELLETVIFETWDRYRHWESVVKVALSLLELRGPEQFARERGGQLYLQVRAQILLACMRRRAPVPAALVRATFHFESSSLRRRWRRHHVASPGSVCVMSFRLVNLHAAALADGSTICGGIDGRSAGELACGRDPRGVREATREIEADLAAWREGAPADWRFAASGGAAGPAGGQACFGGKRHVYPSLWIAEVWNNWRTLRLVLHQIIVRNEARASAPNEALRAAAEDVVREMSVDLCVSVANFVGTPRIISLIQPLYLVALEELNDQRLRAYAVDMLRRIDASTGVRQAGLLARTVLDGHVESPGALGSMAGHLSILLLPSS